MKNDDWSVPQIGITCPVLTNENYEYHLSGDCEEFCICSLNNKKCTGRVIADIDDQSSQFFSRAKCLISQKGLNKCPVYGSSKETFKAIIKERSDRELEEKLKNIK